MHPTKLVLPIFASLLQLSAATSKPEAAHCEPKRCGHLTIAEPFWLDQSPEQATSPCGSIPFAINCVNCTHAYLKNSYRGYFRILDIFYANTSFLVASDHVRADIALFHVPRSSVSEGFGLSPFVVSKVNLELFFYNCKALSLAPPPPDFVGLPCKNQSFASLRRSYRDAGDCNVTVVPAVGFAGAEAGEYMRLIRDGFLLEWMGIDCDKSGGLSPASCGTTE